MADQNMAVLLIPTLNEAQHIEAVITTLLEGSDLSPALDIIVADGGSTDDTVDIANGLRTRFPNLSVLHNPDKTQAAAMNMLLRDDFQHYGFIIRCDAHAGYPPNFIAGIIGILTEKDVASVVIPMDATASQDECFQQGLAWVADTKLGAGGSAHRGGTVSGYVDHGHHAGFRMDVFRELGGYDTQFVANEDAEYDHRLGQSGHQIWMSSDHRIDYFPRTTASRLWTQYYKYGIGRAQTCLKHRAMPKMRQVVPAVHVILLVISSLILPFSNIGLIWPLTYGFVITAPAVLMAATKGSFCGLAVIPALGIMHLSWGLGFLKTILSKALS